MAEIFTFPSGGRSSVHVPINTDFPESGRQRAGRKRNPMRHHYSQTEMAVTVAGKIHRGEALRSDRFHDDLKCLRKGAEAARILANELTAMVEQCAAQGVVDLIFDKVAPLPPDVRQIVEEEVARVMAERDEPA